MKTVAIAIVHWNTPRELRACLASLPDGCAGVAWRAAVVDNASSDREAARAVAAEFPMIDFIWNETNEGFARAANAAARAAGDADAYLLLNPDAVLSPGCVAAAMDALRADKGIAVVGGNISYENGARQQSVRRLPRVWDQLWLLSKLTNYFPSLVKGYAMADFDYERAADVGQVMGAFFLVRAKAWHSLGGLDESFWIWFEEVDFCARAAAAGWRVRYEPSAKLTHARGASFAQVSPLRRQELMNRALRNYARKHWNVFSRALVAAAAAVAWLVSFLLSNGLGRLFKRHDPFA